MNEPMLIHPFQPVIDDDSRVLILGSFPSVISRAQNFYYANPQNRFWSVMKALFEDDPGTDSTQKTAFCIRHHIALWDVIYSCSIQGSSDASIKDAVPAPIGTLVKNTRIHAVFTTGRTASDLYQKYIHLSIRHISLPSTSSANARMHLDDLIKAYEPVKYYAEKD